MGDDGQLIYLVMSGTLAVGQPQPSAHGLLGQGLRRRCPQRNNGVEVGNVPAFLQHVDMNHNLDPAFRVFKFQKLLNVILFFFSALVGMDLHNLVAVAPLEEGGRLDQRFNL